ncbi:MAG: DUF6922 domain-containing protein [Saprospiraceae bacterium]
MKLELRPSLFWDTDLSKMDLQKHRKFIIERTLMRGMKEEFDLILKFYGWDTVKESVVTARYLDKYSLSFCSVIFEVPKTEFRCYKLAQSNPGHWNY